MLTEQQTVQSVTICKALLRRATLVHLWGSKGLNVQAAQVYQDIQESHPQDAAILHFVMAMLGLSDGPTVKELMELPSELATALLTAPLAAGDPQRTLLWLCLHDSNPEPSM